MFLHLCDILFTGGGGSASRDLHLGGLHPGGSASKGEGICIQWVCIQRESASRGHLLPRGKKGLHPGRGGLHPVGSASWEEVGLHQGQVCIQEDRGLHPGGGWADPPPIRYYSVVVVVVRILLECILVFKSLCSIMIMAVDSWSVGCEVKSRFFVCLISGIF